MRKIILITASIIAFSSNISAQTTLEEYNYITKGYQAQIESGLDMKKGYELEDISERATAERKVSLKKLYKTVGGQKKVAAYMVVYSREGNPKEYICIPNPTSETEVSTKFWNNLYDGTADVSLKLQIICDLLLSGMKW